MSRSETSNADAISLVMKSIRRITRAMDIRSKRVAIEAGLTIPQIVLLDSLDRHGELTTAQISAQADLSPSTTVLILDRLEARGLVRRHRSKVDRRVVHCMLTHEGKKILDTAPVPFDENFIESFSQLSPRQRGDLVHSLQTMADLLDRPPIVETPPRTRTGRRAVNRAGR